MKNESIKESVQEYYGKTLQSGDDLKTNACCTVQNYPAHIKEAMALIHDEVHQRYYGCGLTIPHELQGRKVLDLGSGAGRDAYILSKLVGEKGQVVGVDMTDEQLEVANRHLDYHAQKFGHHRSNISFLKGEIEKLHLLDLPDNHFDVVVSNCVINLCPDKEAVLRQVYRVLKPGGELYFSDVYADRRIPQELQRHQVLWGECLSGALYWNDFLTLSKKCGFLDPRAVESAPVTIENEELQELVGNIKFYSVTYRLFKLPSLESDCENYGQSVTYKGTLPDSNKSFFLDHNHIFEAGKISAVCGNTWRMLKETRFEKHFDFTGDFSTHYGIFEAPDSSAPFNALEKRPPAKGSCC